jgi:cbb3-type cytochrome oxidase maturation protein
MPVSPMLYLITGVGLILFVAAVAALVLLVRHGQFDDLDTPPSRILGDDPEAPPKGKR